MSDGSSSPSLSLVSTRRLSDRDAAIVDAILGSRATGMPAPLAPDQAERAARITAILSLLEADPVEPAPADLTARTMQRVRQHRQQQRFAAQAQMLGEERGRGFGFGMQWGQFFSAAAIVTVAMSMLFPVLARNQADARQVACANNLAAAGLAFGQYAAANNDVLPRLPVKPGSVWWNVGQPNGTSEDDPTVHSNSAHLFVLIATGHADARTLWCPSPERPQPKQVAKNQRDWSGPREVSFSYQNQYTDKPIRVADNPSLALLADRNPLFVYSNDGKLVTFARGTPMHAPSRSHGSQGQNILTADRSVRWTVRPMVARGGSVSGEDNVWTVPNREVYEGRETPVVDRDGRVDSFLVP